VLGLSSPAPSPSLSRAAAEPPDLADAIALFPVQEELVGSCRRVAAVRLSDSELSFYSTAAQVIPVLLLALAVELPTIRALEHLLIERRPDTDMPTWVPLISSLLLLAMVSLMFVGELVSLSMLAGHRIAVGNAKTWAMVGLISGVSPVLLGVVEHSLTRARHSSTPSNPPTMSLHAAPGDSRPSDGGARH
jgi:hypothetical protein